MPFADTWLRNQWQPDPDRFTVQNPPDPGHGDRSEPTNAVVMQDAPLLQGGGEIITDAQQEHDYVRPATVLIDQTPVGHGTPSGVNAEKAGHAYGGTTQPLGDNVGYGRAVMGVLRGRDLGADRRATVQVGRPYRFFDDQYISPQSDGLDDTPLSDMTGSPILVRGLNAYDANDGDGGRVRGNGSRSWRVNGPSWKLGRYMASNVQRGAFHPPRRTHNVVKMNQPHVVTIVGDAPPPRRSDKYASPYSSLQRFGLNTAGGRKPGMRRQPGAWDEQIVAANTDRQVVEAQSIDGAVIA